MYELMPGKRKFIKILQIKDNKYVEFLFAIDQATTNMEMLLPYKEFINFCKRNSVSFVDTQQEEEMNKDDVLWKYGTEEF